MTIQVFNTFDKFTVDVVAGKSITVTREGRAPNKFKIGDQAKYSYYNLGYFGAIKSITEKTVTIVPRFDGGSKRLKLIDFAWRNYNFNLENTIAKNADTMMYI